MFLYTEPFPQRSLCTEQFLHMFFLHKNHLTQRNLYAQTAHRSFYRLLQTDFRARRNFTQSSFYTAETFSHRSLYAQTKLRTTIFTDRRLLHRKFSAQKGLHLHTTFFTYRRFYAQMSLHSHRHKLHTETCAHSTRLHTANFYTERLCFHFLITYLSCSTSQA